MAYAILRRRALSGLRALPVAVQVHLSGGLEEFNLFCMRVSQFPHEAVQRYTVGAVPAFPVTDFPEELPARFGEF